MAKTFRKAKKTETKIWAKKTDTKSERRKRIQNLSRISNSGCWSSVSWLWSRNKEILTDCSVSGSCDNWRVYRPMESLNNTDKRLVNSYLKEVRANCFCASLLRTTGRANSHATSCIERARQVLKWTMIGQMAIAIALLRFSDLGRSVTPTFLFRNRFHLQLSPHCSKVNKKSMWEVKKISRFLSTGHEILPSCGCKARETVVFKCELIR